VSVDPYGYEGLIHVFKNYS